MLLIPKYLLSLMLLCAGTSVFALDLKLADPHLQSCVDKLAQKHKWTSVEEVTDITCHNSDISSLAGIDQFTNLEKASFHKNSIENISLRGLHRLQHLNVSRTGLKELELADLPALEELYLFRNQVDKLTLTDLPALQLLKANSNAMTEFVYDKLPALARIYLFDNKLKDMDIHNLPALEYLDARQNPMSDELYDEMDQKAGATILHDGNADDW